MLTSEDRFRVIRLGQATNTRGEISQIDPTLANWVTQSGRSLDWLHRLNFSGLRCYG